MAINWDSILKKAQQHMDTPAMKKKVNQKVDDVILSESDLTGTKNVHTALDAGYKFADVLINDIRVAGLPKNVAELLENSVDVLKPYKLTNGTYKVCVYFDKDLQRDSMSTKKEYKPINLAGLYNYGVDHIMRQIFETTVDETGRKVLQVSTTVIPGTFFMEHAKDDFMGNFATDYNVIEITINENMNDEE